MEASRAQGGKRFLQGASTSPGAPLVTVITATRNAARELRFTLASLRSQAHADWEWIVIDGASTDETVALLASSEDAIDYWLSEPDRGIYDAWNKACALARGQWILFLGAGDELASSDVLGRMAVQLRGAYPQYVLAYGKVQHLSATGRTPLDVAGEPWEALRGKWELMRPALPPHGAVFHHRSLLAGPEPFDTRFRVAGDSHLLLRHLAGRAPLFIPQIVNRAPIGGLSFTLAGASEVAREIAAINRLLGIRPPWRHALAERVLLAGKIALARWLPERAAWWLADLYRLLAGKGRRWSVK